MDYAGDGTGADALEHVLGPVSGRRILQLGKLQVPRY